MREMEVHITDLAREKILGHRHKLGKFVLGKPDPGGSVGLKNPDEDKNLLFLFEDSLLHAKAAKQQMCCADENFIGAGKFSLQRDDGSLLNVIFGSDSCKDKERYGRDRPEDREEANQVMELIRAELKKVFPGDTESSLE